MKRIPQDEDEVADPRQLPHVTKPQLMANFDRVVTDPRVRCTEVEGFLADPAHLGEPYLGRYMAWTTSGMTGHPGIFVHDERAWMIYKVLGATRGLLRWLGPPGQAPGQGRLARPGQAADQHQARPPGRVLQLAEGQQPVGPGPHQGRSPLGLRLRELHPLHLAPHGGAVGGVERQRRPGAWACRISS